MEGLLVLGGKLYFELSLLDSHFYNIIYNFHK